MEIALTENARTVLSRRYLGRDDAGRPTETPEALFRRVARAVAAADHAPAEVEERFFQRMARLEFLPNSPTLMNAGRPLGQLAACFVVPVGDSMPEIFEAVKWAATIQMSGGGTGFSFSRLRPSGDFVSSTSGVASGPLPFMDVFNAATDAVKQGGTRRGANMGVLRVDHPDVLEFVTAKLDPRRLANFNVSVGVTDAFMAALAAGGDYALISPRTGREVRRLSARRVWDIMVGAAWAMGEPGVIFLDRINATQPTPSLGLIESTNPCGEQPLLPFESCVLGSLNLAAFVDGKDVAWPRLREAIHDGTRFLDDVIDANRYPLPEIERVTKANRKIGLGVMGFHDLLIRLGIAYDDEAALALGEKIAAFLETESLAESARLAVVRGAFPNWERSRWALTAQAPLRNATTTTVAPTGTISIIAGCSSGIEPIFAVSFVRHVLDGERLVEIHPELSRLTAARGLASESTDRLLAERGRARGLAELPADLQRLFPTAHDLSPEVHVRMQAVFQKHCHAAVSKTVNFPPEATAADVARVYRLAYDLGCKGVTVYRDGSRAGQVLRFGAAEVATPAPEPPEGDKHCPECGNELVGGGGRCLACRHCGWSVCL